MATYKTRISQISKTNGKIILANDYDHSVKNLEAKTIQNLKKLNQYLCAIKLNFHLLLPLGSKQISKITQTAHDYGLQTIADIKLNDIGNTNRVTLENLWDLGFDAVIANPIMVDEPAVQAANVIALELVFEPPDAADKSVSKISFRA